MRLFARALAYLKLKPPTFQASNQHACMQLICHEMLKRAQQTRNFGISSRDRFECVNQCISPGSQISPMYVIVGDSVKPDASPNSIFATKICHTSVALQSRNHDIINGMLTTIIARFLPK